MQMLNCPNCNRYSGFKRAIGIGTLFMVLLTFGLWLVVIPLYPARCINCGLTRGAATDHSLLFMCLGVFAVYLLFKAIAN